jgi:hypothetical protein
VEIFIKKNSENKIWLGFHISHGLVILDRSIGKSESDEGYLFFKCSDWSIYKETDAWEKPNYIYIIPYLNSLDKDKIKSAKEDATKKLNYYVDKIKDMHFELLKVIHNIYLIKKGLEPQLIVKSNKKFRESVCKECKIAVDNSKNYECIVCRWIVCSNCGACKHDAHWSNL